MANFRCNIILTLKAEQFEHQCSVEQVQLSFNQGQLDPLQKPPRLHTTEIDPAAKLVAIPFYVIASRLLLRRDQRRHLLP